MDGIDVGGAMIEMINGNKTLLKLHDINRKTRFLNYLHSRISYYNQEKRWQNSIFWQRRHGKSQFYNIVKSIQ